MDTSVWVAVLRADPGAPMDHLRELLRYRQVLLAVPVCLELLSGLRREKERWLEGDLAVLRAAYPSGETWQQMEQWCAVAVEAGQRFGFADLLIAALAAEAGADVWSLDRAFERMERLGFIRCYRPRR